MDTVIPEGTERYFLVYDAYADMAEPISHGEAINRLARTTAMPLPDRESGHDLGYDLEDGDVLVAFKLSGLERILAEQRGETKP